MRTSGFGVFYDHDDIPDGEMRRSPDGTRVAAFWIRRQKEDRFDHDTVYQIAIWDAVSKQQVDSCNHIHAINRLSGEVDGEPLADLRFDADGRLLLVFASGATEPVGTTNLDEVPPWERRRQAGTTTDEE